MSVSTSQSVASMIRADAGNDSSGNPRRAYLALSDDGRVIGAWWEGYEGSDAVPEQYRGMASGCVTIPTKMQWLRNAIKAAAERG